MAPNKNPTGLPSVPPGQRDPLPSRISFLQSANSSFPPYLRVPLKQNSASAPKPSPSCQITVLAPGFRTVPHWTHYVGTCGRSLSCRPFRREDLDQFRAGSTRTRDTDTHRNHILQQRSYELSNQPTLPLKLLLLLYSRSSPLEQQADHVCPLPSQLTNQSQKGRCLIDQYNRVLEARCDHAISKDSMET